MTNAHPRRCFVRLLCHRSDFLPAYDSTQLSMLGWHPREDFIFMFANLPPYLPKVAINTLLCLPEKYLKEQFVRVLYGLTWQYSWLMAAAKFGGCPRDFPNLICLGVLHLSIIPARLYLCGLWTPLLGALVSGLFRESHILQGDLPKKPYNLFSFL